jgi:hypothetical protein
MTVETTASEITAQGTGGNFTWPFPFKIPGASSADNSNVTVVLTNIGTTPFTQTTVSQSAFTIFGAGEDSGSVTYPLTGSAITAGYYLTILRTMPDTQNTDITNQSGFYLEVIEDALDYQMMLFQNYYNRLQMALQYNPADPTPPTAPVYLPFVDDLAGKFLAFNSAGFPIASAGSPGTVAASTFMQTVLGATNSAAANALLGTVGISSFMTKGDILVAPTASSASALVIGGNGLGILADTNSSQGMAWRVIGTGAINGLVCNPNSSSAATKLDIAFSGAVLRNTAGGIIATNTAATLTVDITTSGPVALGRDSSSALSSSSSAYFYLIGSPTTVSALVSANSASPTLPTGYTAWQLAAAVRVVTASQLLATYVRGTDHAFQARQTLFLSTASSTSEATASLSTLIPPVAQNVRYILDLAGSATAGGSVNSVAVIKLAPGVTAAQMSFTCNTSGIDANSTWLDLPYVGSSIYYNLSSVTNISTLNFQVSAQGYTVPNGAS